MAPGDIPTDVTDLPTDVPGRSGTRARPIRRSTAEFAHALSGQGRLGRFEVRRRLGRGGMGTIYEAVDEALDRPVALKVLHTRMSAVQEQRFKREAQALAQLQHRNVVQVYSVERSHGRLFIAMELIEGQTLDEWHAERRPWAECVAAYVQAGRGLAAAHKKGLIHRDFNPQNCLIDEEGRVRVLDFGLVLGMPDDDDDDDDDDGSAPSGGSAPGGADQSQRLTRTGEVLGTWAYMPFESLSGRIADARSDQFSFCVALYEGLYGERPYRAQSAYEQILELEQGRLRPAPPGSAVPRGVRRVLARGLSLRPEDRWPSMDALLDRLERQIAPRRRRRWIMGTGAAGLVGVLAVVSWPSAEPLCRGAAEHLGGIWDLPTQQRVEAQILAVEGPHVADTWARLEPRLDRYAEDWIGAHTDACEDTRLRGEQAEDVLDLRMRCLDDARRALEALVETFEASDATSVSRSLAAVDGLPSIERCADEEYVRNQQVLPGDPELRAQSEALDRKILRAWALQGAGRYGEALTAGEEVEAATEQLGLEPLFVEALLVKGFAYLQLGRFEDAIEPMERAFFEGKRLGLRDLPFKAAHQIAFTLGLRLRRTEAARDWVDHARAEAERWHDEWFLARVLLMQSILDAYGGDLDQVDNFNEVLRVIEATRGTEHPEVARVLKNMGTLYLQRGELAEAERVLTRALSIEEKGLGPHHPYICDTLANLGSVYHSQEKFEAARQAFSRSLALTEEHFDPEHPKVARSLDLLGNAEVGLGQLQAAKEHCQRALELRKRIAGADHPDVAASHMSLGRIALDSNDLDAAQTHFERARAIREEAFGADHPATIDALGAVGDAHMGAGRHASALEAHRSALERAERTMGAEHVWTVEHRKDAGRALLGLGRPKEAQQQLRRALAIAQREQLSSDRLDVLRFYLARARLAVEGIDAEGLAEIRAVRRSLVEARGQTHGPLLAEIDAYLATHSE